MFVSDDTRRDTVEKAKRAITFVRDSYNTETVRCEHCGADRFVDWNERQMREQLNGAITRLERVLDRIGKQNRGD